MQARQPIVVRRPVKAMQVPSGEAADFEPGQTGVLAQALGGSYTIYAYGSLWRIDGRDGDAIGMPVRERAARPPSPSDAQLEQWVWEELREVYDPEIPCNIVDLGLVYRCELAKQPDGQYHVVVAMTVTAPGCGVGEQLCEEAADRLVALPRIAEARVDLVFDPPWSRGMMTEAARLTLGLL